MRYAVAILFMLVALVQIATIKELNKVGSRVFDLHQTVACLEGGNKIEQKINAGPDEYNRFCMLNGKVWISWRAG